MPDSLPAVSPTLYATTVCPIDRDKPFTRVILETRDLIQRFVTVLKPQIVTAHDLHQVVSAVVTALGETDLTRYYTELSYLINTLNLINFERRFPTLEEKHYLTAAIVEFGVDFLERVKLHGLYHENHGDYDSADPFPYIFTQLSGGDTLFLRVHQ